MKCLEVLAFQVSWTEIQMKLKSSEKQVQEDHPCGSLSCSSFITRSLSMGSYPMSTKRNTSNYMAIQVVENLHKAVKKVMFYYSYTVLLITYISLLAIFYDNMFSLSYLLAIYISFQRNADFCKTTTTDNILEDDIYSLNVMP